MADKFVPWVNPEDGEPFVHDINAKWWSDLGNGLQAEVQQGVWPGAANLVIFDSSHNNRVVHNEVVAVAGVDATEDEVSLWQTKATSFIDSL